MFKKKVPEICNKCEFKTRPTCPSEYNENAKGLIIAEVPWQAEVQGLGKGPLQGTLQSDKLGELLAEADLQREDFNVTHVVKCMPFTDKDTHLSKGVPTTVLKRCTENFLFKEIKETNPNVIVTLGDLAMRGLTKRSGIKKNHGIIIQQPFEGLKKPIKVISSFHPTFLVNNPGLTPLATNDWKFIAEQYESRDVVTVQEYKGHYKEITTNRAEKLFRKWIKKKCDIAVDFETIGLDPQTLTILSCSFTPKPKYSYIVHFNKCIQDRKGKFKKLKHFKKPFSKKFATALYDLLHSGIKIYGQNFKDFELRIFKRYFKETINKEIDVTRLKFHELMLLQNLVDENLPKDLKSAAHRLTPIRYTKKELDAVGGGRIKHVHSKDLAIYNGKDTDATLRCAYHHVKTLKETFDGNIWKLYLNHEMHFMRWLWRMEMFGMHASRQRFEKMRKVCVKRQARYKKVLTNFTGKNFNPNSADQLRIFLFEKLGIKGLKGYKTNKGKIAVDIEHLKALKAKYNHPFLVALLHYNEYKKMVTTLTTFLENMDEHDIIHTKFQPYAVTGRVLSRDPNILNVARDKEFMDGKILSLRSAFVARPGYKYIVADYSQIELKCLAILANVVKILEGLKRGEDFHTLTAREGYGKTFKKAEIIVKKGEWKGKKLTEKVINIWKQRYEAMRTSSKTFNFALVFGSGDETLAESLSHSMKKPVSVAKVKIMRERFDENYPEITDFIRDAGRLAEAQGFVELPVPISRVRRFHKTNDRRMLAKQQRQAFNMYPQGIAGYIGRFALYRILNRFEKEKIKGFPVNIVYDAIMSEVAIKDIKRASKIMVEEMLRPVKFLDNFVFGIKIGIGDDWQSAEKNGVKINSLNDYVKLEEQKHAA